MDSPFHTEAALPPVDVLTERWARALCSASGGQPEQRIGLPPTPRWRSWVRVAELAIRAFDEVEANCPACRRQLQDVPTSLGVCEDCHYRIAEDLDAEDTPEERDDAESRRAACAAE